MALQTIKLKKYSDVIEEYEANAVIIPGMLVELMSTGKVRAHATSTGNAVPMFALEDELQGKGIDDDYAAGDQVQCWIPYRGDQVDALLRDEETVVIGDLLESDGQGRLKKYSADIPDSSFYIYPLQIVAVALEAVDLSSLPEGSESSAGGTYHNPRIKVRIV
jgi:hypothetical protein